MGNHPVGNFNPHQPNGRFGSGKQYNNAYKEFEDAVEKEEKDFEKAKSKKDLRATKSRLQELKSKITAQNQKTGQYEEDGKLLSGYLRRIDYLLGGVSVKLDENEVDENGYKWWMR